MKPPRLLSYAEVSVIIGCSVKTVRRRVRDGDLVAVIDGGLRRITEDDLTAYILGRRRTPTGPRSGARPSRPARRPGEPPENRHGGRVRKLWEDGHAG